MRKGIRNTFVCIGCCLSLSTTLQAQTEKAENVWAVKSNVLYDAVGTLNVGVEYAFNRQWSAELSGAVNPFQFPNDKQWKIIFAQPEVRYWFKEAFHGHFVGAHLQSGTFNAANIKLPFNLAPQLEATPHQGWFVGAGISYGYQWQLGKNWCLEANIGLGYNYFDYESYCPDCHGKLGEGHKNYWGITKAGISFIYLIR